MRHLLSRVVARWNHDRGRARHARPAVVPPDRRSAARQLCRAIDRATSIGLREHADRVASTAAACATEYAPLAERLARLRLEQGRPDVSLAIIHACHAPHPASLRMLRVVCLLQLGARVEAQLELQEWCRKASAPLDARLLLALLEFDSGDAAAAIDSLLRNLKHFQDPRTLAALLVIAIGRGRSAQAEHWSRRLHEASPSADSLADTALVLRSLGLSPGAPGNAAEMWHARAGDLALELIGNESIIPALVEAQRRAPEPATAPLLRHALERALPDLADEPAAIAALARLSIVLGDRNAAADWVERGRAAHPMSAGLAMLAEELASSRAPAAEPVPIRDVLATIGAATGSEGETRSEAA